MWNILVIFRWFVKFATYIGRTVDACTKTKKFSKSYFDSHSSDTRNQGTTWAIGQFVAKGEKHSGAILNRNLRFFSDIMLLGSMRTVGCFGGRFIREIRELGKPSISHILLKDNRQHDREYGRSWDSLAIRIFLWTKYYRFRKYLQLTLVFFTNCP